jgi:hypothetical protein
VIRIELVEEGTDFCDDSDEPLRSISKESFCQLNKYQLFKEDSIILIYDHCRHGFLYL